jgi:maleylacetoacetate isomerase
MLKLYDYWRSSAAYRVRIALHLKGLAYDSVPVNLMKGEQSTPDYMAHNPQGLVPLLMEGDHSIAQSMAIIEYLDETHPAPPLLPKDPYLRAHVRAIANVIACDIHPVNNLRILNYLKTEMAQPQDAIDGWYRHWITQGFAALERQAHSNDYMFGDHVTLADICLVPQMTNARRFNTDLTPFQRLVAIDAHLRTLPAFEAAAPENQKDAVIA